MMMVAMVEVGVGVEGGEQQRWWARVVDTEVYL